MKDIQITFKDVKPFDIKTHTNPNDNTDDKAIDFFGLIQCGFPSPATDYIEKGLNLHDHIVKKPAATFFMRAAGDSMIDAGIFPDDILVIDRSVDPRTGHIVVVQLNGEMTLKRLSYHFGKVHLIPENKKYKIIQVSDTDDFQIFGVLTHSIHAHLVTHIKPKKSEFKND